MKKITIIYTLVLLVFAINYSSAQSKFEKDKAEIGTMLDGFNVAAAKADYTAYFNYFADESTFIGTDATEVWDKKAFMVWAKPYFDKKKTWNFTSLKRNVYFSKDGKLAWFDELLDTQMKICRGSGVVEKINGSWKVKQYVLSVTVPNDVIDKVVAEKAPIEDVLLQQLKTK
ncbi:MULTISPECIES: nuclear transport factor 2 family protein [Chryseobacterium]|uniref:nuclear transport factor 2 family protein n=1 Tax=Chryseobacterium TaxID=59732 RepID=UPI002359F1B4|nr:MULTISPECIES: nuclear transport factor 2 family protein [unclassified Chryseobacterium]MDC8103290.1 nuclear transport factor 2 family protein [Chryseobacterium sp. B21-037]MDQ1802843.1 nuclear transport factor 2 family protein [Chryseobacterium sp. CKR4-1]